MLRRPALSNPRPRALGLWLLFVVALVFAIVIVGGITRLTESGLSITEWKPIRGIIPPLDAVQWQAEFDGYKAIPQYRTFNSGMTLEAFKHIYFWEYVHRLLARAIAAVLGLVLLVFWWRRTMPQGYGKRVLVILALGGLQAAIGWWMVASGLQHRTEVSHLRLAVHLLAAMLIYAVLIWLALDLLSGDDKRRRPSGLAIAALAALAGQLGLGAFTAGLRAGYAFASWPKMGDHWFPPGGWAAGQGLAANLSSNPVVVQFAHRWWAWLVAALALALAWQARARAPAAALAVAAAIVIQIGLGIATLLSGVALPLAVAHQAVAALLLGTIVWAAHSEHPTTGYHNTTRD